MTRSNVKRLYENFTLLLSAIHFKHDIKSNKSLSIIWFHMRILSYSGYISVQMFSNEKLNFNGIKKKKIVSLQAEFVMIILSTAVKIDADSKSYLLCKLKINFNEISFKLCDSQNLIFDSISVCIWLIPYH